MKKKKLGGKANPNSASKFTVSPKSGPKAPTMGKSLKKK